MPVDGGGDHRAALIECLPVNAVIQVDGLIKRFGDVVAVDGVDLTVEQGTVFGLLGPNGAGKTTIIRVLTTILRPDGGTASVLGIDVASDPQAVRERIGLAGQYAAVDEDLTGRENLRLMGRLTHLDRALVVKRADELLERFALTDAADRPLKTYSGGMRRRLDLAAALVHRPTMLFLDEPTTGLDVYSRNELWAIISELVSDGTSVLLTTQYLEEADSLANRIAVIDHGRKVAEGTAAELKATLGATIVEIGYADVASADRALTAPRARWFIVDPAGRAHGARQRHRWCPWRTRHRAHHRSRSARAPGLHGARTDLGRCVPLAHRSPGRARCTTRWRRARSRRAVGGDG